MKILFATGNARKMGEARLGCAEFGIEVEQVVVGIEEIQHHDPIKITEQKVSDTYAEVGKPIVVTDTSWNIPALNGFPGGYMKDVAAWFSPRDFIALMADKPDWRVCFTETIAYTDGDMVKMFSKEYWGEILHEPKGVGNAIEQVASFNGRTLAESHDVGEYSHETKDYIWYEFAEWYAGQYEDSSSH